MAGLLCTGRARHGRRGPAPGAPLSMFAPLPGRGLHVFFKGGGSTKARFSRHPLSMAFGSRREEPNGSREDRDGRGVTFGQTTLLKLECLQAGSSPERTQVIVRRGQLWSGGSPAQGSRCAAKGREILLGDPHEGAQVVGAQRGARRDGASLSDLLDRFAYAVL
jgi:hypothetical protein